MTISTWKEVRIAVLCTIAASFVIDGCPLRGMALFALLVPWEIAGAWLSHPVVEWFHQGKVKQEGPQPG